jgi:hypothetical protein
MSARKIALLVRITLVSLATAFGQSPPANDDFANRTVVTGSSVTFPGTLVVATYEAAETNAPNIYYLNHDGVGNGGGSVWWTWTAPQSSTVVIQPLRDYSVPVAAATAFEVYAGTNLNSLTRVDGDSFDLPAGRYAEFSATAGVSYQIQVAGSWTSSFSLKLTATNSPLFLIQPQSCVVSPYGSAFFSAFANLHDSYLSGPLYGKIKGYQWTFNGVPIPGEIYPILIVHGVTTNQAGNYSVIASNWAGLAESAVVTLTVTDTNPVPQIAALRPNNATQLPFTLTAEPGRWYEIESSQDLQNWVNPSWMQATNPSSFLSVPRLGPSHFVRASLNSSTDVCVAQLKRVRAAGAMYVIDNNSRNPATYGLQNLTPYIPPGHGSDGLPLCPENGMYMPGPTVTNAPMCSVGHGHEIADP